MKKLKQLSFIGLALIFILASCSVEKRRYMSGYYVSHNSSTKSLKNNTANEEIVKNTTVKRAASKVMTEDAGVAVLNNYQVSDNNVIVAPSKSTAKTSGRIINLHKTKVPASVKVSETKTFVAAAKKSAAQKKGPSDHAILYIILAILIPFVAVGLATDWGIETLWNILWCLLCGIPGIIHAFIILKRKDII